MKNFKKIVHLGSGEAGPVFCSIEWRAPRLSISGVEGPKPNGDCRGSCGQIVMHRPKITRYGPGWNAASVAKFWEMWDEWHLNDMRAGCEHQRRDWDIRENLEVVEYGLTTEASRLRKETRRAAADAQLLGERLELTDTARALAELKDWYKPRYSPPDADSPLSGCYEVKKREKKLAGWVRQDEHPRGLLCKPCGECGYKYGTKWLLEEVPSVVIGWLNGLPESEKVPAWV